MVGLDEYATAKGQRLKVADWFAAHPEVEAEIVEARPQVIWRIIWTWLVEEHGFPGESHDGVRRYFKER